MVRQIAAGLLSLILSASVAAAQDTSSGESGFCATAPQALLVALDGSWNLTQGAGSAFGKTSQGQIAIPLPPQPPQAMMLEYDPAQGLTIMSSQGQQILMVPTVSNPTTGPEELLTDLADLLGSTDSTTGCDWFALPTILGTNVYSLSGSDAPPSIDDVDVNLGYFDLGPEEFYEDGNVVTVCYGGSAYLIEDMNWMDFKMSEYESQFCDDLNRRRPGQGNMIMTIAVKFDSPSSGRGVIAFEGELDGAEFNASAPITMSR